MGLLLSAECFATLLFALIVAPVSGECKLRLLKNLLYFGNYRSRSQDYNGIRTRTGQSQCLFHGICPYCANIFFCQCLLLFLGKMIMRIPRSGEDNPVCHTFHGSDHTGIILILRNSHNNSAIPNPQMSQDFLYILTAGGIDTGIQQNKRLGTQDFHASRPV